MLRFQRNFGFRQFLATNLFSRSELKLVDNKSYHHFRSNLGLKSHIWPFPNGKTWRKKQFRRNLGLNFSTMFFSSFWAQTFVNNKSDHHLKTKPGLKSHCLNGNTWQDKIPSKLLNFPGFSNCDFMPDFDVDGRTCYLPV
jgi:hypothetical protein